ncbi:MAG: hypothetical protein ABEK59_08830 [Halobacteria archaeon]
MQIDIKEHIDKLEQRIAEKDLSPREKNNEVWDYVDEEIPYKNWQYADIVKILAQLKKQHGYDDTFVTSEVDECDTWRQMFDSMIRHALFSVLHDHVMDSHDGMIREDTDDMLEHDALTKEEVEDLIDRYTEEAEKRAADGEVPDVEENYEHHTLRLNTPESGEAPEKAAYHTVKDHYRDIHGEQMFIPMASVLDGLEELYDMDGESCGCIDKDDVIYESRVGWKDVIEQGLVFPAVKCAVKHNMET